MTITHSWAVLRRQEAPQSILHGAERGFRRVSPSWSANGGRAASHSFVAPARRSASRRKPATEALATTEMVLRRPLAAAGAVGADRWQKVQGRHSHRRVAPRRLPRRLHVCRSWSPSVATGKAEEVWHNQSERPDVPEHQRDRLRRRTILDLPAGTGGVDSLVLGPRQRRHRRPRSS